MTDDHPSDRTPDDLGSPDGDPDQLPPLIRPAVDRIARIRATIHAKLLAGFLIIAVLLLAMGVTSILVIRQMNARAHDQIELSNQSDLARQAIYAVTSQSHYRAMALDHVRRLVERQDRDRRRTVSPRTSTGSRRSADPGCARASIACARSMRGTRRREPRCCPCTKQVSSIARSTCTCPPSTRSRTRSRTS